MLCVINQPGGPWLSSSSLLQDGTGPPVINKPDLRKSREMWALAGSRLIRRPVVRSAVTRREVGQLAQFYRLAGDLRRCRRVATSYLALVPPARQFRCPPLVAFATIGSAPSVGSDSGFAPQ